MTSANESITTPGMRASAALFEDAHSTIQGYIASVSDALANLLRVWGGSAGASFASGFAHWQEDVSTILSELNDMAGIMQGTAADYDKVVEDAQSYVAFMNTHPLPGM
jgi:WXG100 family type VII secretion target